MLANGENFGVSLISSLWACLGKSSDTKSQPQSSVKGSMAGLRLLAVTPKSLWGPQRMAMYYLCKEELCLASHSIWAPAEQQAHPGFHMLLLWALGIQLSYGADPTHPGKVSTPRVTESRGRHATMVFKTLSDSSLDHVFGSCKTQVGTLSYNQGGMTSLPLHPDFQKWKTFHFCGEGQGTLGFLLSHSAQPRWELLGNGRKASLHSLLPQVSGARF